MFQAGSGLFSLGRGDDQGDASARTELAADLHPARRARLHEVGEDAVHGLLVERVVVAEGIEVELEGLAFDAELVGDIPDADVPEVGLSGHGAQARELRAVEQDLVVTLRIGVEEGLEFRLVRGVRLLGMAAGKQGQGRMGESLRRTFFRLFFVFGHFLRPFRRYLQKKSVFFEKNSKKSAIST